MSTFELDESLTIVTLIEIWMISRTTFYGSNLKILLDLPALYTEDLNQRNFLPVAAVGKFNRP